MKRTHLPLNGLRVLDAAARHLSFTRAADELAVTPAAVGQQIRALEDTLGVVLFRRTTKGLELTPEGEAGLGPLRQGFLEFEEAVRAMQAGQTSKSLTIAAPRDFTEKWLMPRLADIARGDAELRFALVSADEDIDFTEANLDLAIRWGDGPGAHEGEALESEGLVTVERPGGGVDTRISWPGCLNDDSVSLVRVGDAGLALDAAAEGLLAGRAAAAMAAEEGPRAGRGARRRLSAADGGMDRAAGCAMIRVPSRRSPMNAPVLDDAERKTMVIAYVLLVFLGGLGAHRFYLGRPVTAVAQLLLHLTGWLLLSIGVGLMLLYAVSIWIIVDLFLIPGMVRARMAPRVPGA